MMTMIMQIENKSGMYKDKYQILTFVKLLFFLYKW